MIALQAQTGPVFLTYRASSDVEAIARRTAEAPPAIDINAADGSGKNWKVDRSDCGALVAAVGGFPRCISPTATRAASAREHGPN